MSKSHLAENGPCSYTGYRRPGKNAHAGRILDRDVRFSGKEGGRYLRSVLWALERKDISYGRQSQNRDSS